MSKVYSEILFSTGAGLQVHYHTEPLTVMEFYGKAELLEIPPYQRPYSWGARQVESLLKDILEVHKNEGSWFLGSFFVTKTAATTAEMSILDGQQRTTTIQLVSLVLYSKLKVIKDDNHKQEADLLTRQLSLLVLNLHGEPKFKASEEFASKLSEFIKEWVYLSSEAEFSAKMNEFITSAQATSQSRTALRIAENLKIIKEWVEKEVAQPEALFGFVSAMLNQCWLIQIPLQNDAVSVKIFEALNNRGLSLSLLDKIRFRTLISFDLSNAEITDLKKAWGRVYNMFSRLETSRLIKNEYDLCRVFMNLDGYGRDSEDDFFGYLESKYARKEGAFNLLAELEAVLQFLLGVDSPNSSDNGAIALIWPGFSNINEAKKHEVRALLQVIRSSILASSNCRFLWLRLVVEKVRTNIDSSDIEQAAWDVIRNVFLNVVCRGTKSNQVRTDMLEICKENDWNTFSRKLALKLPQKMSHLSNLVFQPGSNQDHSRLLMMLYGYFSNKAGLATFVDEHVRSAEVDHLFPRAWKNNWSEEAKFAKSEVQEVLKKAEGVNTDCFEYEVFLTQLASEDFPLECKEYDSRPFTKDNVVVEMIGNRWLLSKKLNRTSSNRGLDAKKVDYRDVGFRVPFDNDLVGIDNYSSFGYEQICLRSLKIAETIYRGLLREHSNHLIN